MLIVSDLRDQAIEAALKQDWQEALRINKSILQTTPDDIETKNRLAKSYCELGNILKAKKTYEEVLKIDAYNQIALKNVKLLSKINGTSSLRKTNGEYPNGNGSRNGHTNGQTHENGNGHKLNFNIFLSEPGKTKLINLVHLATPRILSSLSSGDKIELVIKRHCIQLVNLDGEYVGALPDDIGHFIITLTSGGNKYEAYVKNITANSLWIILWEKFRAKKFINQPSFIDGKSGYIPYIRQELIKKDPLDFSLDESGEVLEQGEVEQQDNLS